MTDDVSERVGDDAASVPLFVEFYAACRDEIARALALTLRNESLGAEAADEAMARALARWRRVAAMDNPSGWVFRVGLNWGRSVLRRQSRETLTLPPEVRTRDASLDVDLDAALAGLDVKHRAVVVLRYLLGYPEADAARILGVPAGTVKSRLSRAVTQLRSALEVDD